MLYFIIVVDNTCSVSLPWQAVHRLILLSQRENTKSRGDIGYMEQVHTFDGNCPVCGNDMVISRLTCRNCGSALEGSFSLSEHSTRFDAPVRHVGVRSDRGEAHFGHLARLDGAQLEFVEVFLRCRGIIKNVEDMLGISYPTVKARLANVLEAMGFDSEEDLPVADHRRVRREILADLAAGRISTDDALQILAHNPIAHEDKSGT